MAALARAMRFDLDDGRCRVDGVDATIEIRGPEVTRAVSIVAANPGGAGRAGRAGSGSGPTERGGGVIEGRDIGTVVFPDAELKVYLTATPAVRAGRRVADPAGSGLGHHAGHGDRDTATGAGPLVGVDPTAGAAPASRPDGGAVDLGAVEADLARRDQLDSNRAVSPLAQAADAVVIDTSGLGPDEVVEAVLHELTKLAR